MSEETVDRRARMLASLSAPAEPDEAGLTEETDDADPADVIMFQRIGALLAHPGTWQQAPALPAALLAEIRAEPAPAPATAPETEHPLAGTSAEPVPVKQPQADAPAKPSPVETPAADSVPAAEPDRIPAAAPPTRRRLRWSWPKPTFGLAVGLAAAVLVVVMFGGELWQPTDDPKETTAQLQLAGTSSAPNARATVQVVERAAGWRLVLDIEGLAPAAPNYYYEGWAVRGDQYVALGTFHMHQQGQVELWSGVPLREFSRIEVTTQQVGAGQSPGPQVMVGQL